MKTFCPCILQLYWIILRYMISIETTATDIIDALGGNAAVARLTSSATAKAVSNWRAFDKFPCRIPFWF